MPQSSKNLALSDAFLEEASWKIWSRFNGQLGLLADSRSSLFTRQECKIASAEAARLRGRTEAFLLNAHRPPRGCFVYKNATEEKAKKLSRLIAITCKKWWKLQGRPTVHRVVLNVRFVKRVPASNEAHIFKRKWQIILAELPLTTYEHIYIASRPKTWLEVSGKIEHRSSCLDNGLSGCGRLFFNLIKFFTFMEKIAIITQYGIIWKHDRN